MIKVLKWNPYYILYNNDYISTNFEVIFDNKIWLAEKTPTSEEPCVRLFKKEAIDWIDTDFLLKDERFELIKISTLGEYRYHRKW